MTKKELKNKIKALSKELDLMTKYKEEFIEKLGIRGFEREINKRLEDYQYYLTKLKALNDED